MTGWGGRRDAYKYIAHTPPKSRGDGRERRWLPVTKRCAKNKNSKMFLFFLRTNAATTDSAEIVVCNEALRTVVDSSLSGYDETEAGKPEGDAEEYQLLDPRPSRLRTRLDYWFSPFSNTFCYFAGSGLELSSHPNSEMTQSVIR